IVRLADGARVRADQLAHPAGRNELRQADRSVAAVVVHDGELARSLLVQGTDELGGDAGGAEAADQDGGAVVHIGERLGRRGHHLVEHARAPSTGGRPQAGEAGGTGLMAGTRSALRPARATARRGWRTRPAARGYGPGR